LRAEAGFQPRRFRPKARDILVSWARAREYRDGEAGYVQLARLASDPDVRDRFIAIAEHYRSLAKIEQSIADQKSTKKG
jgi:rubrerythrin